MADELTSGGYGWIRSRPDIRDRSLQLPAVGPLPASFLNLVDKCPPIWNQAGEGSCIAHGSLRCSWFARNKAGQHNFMPARQFQYWNSRYEMNKAAVAIDSGATVRAALKALAKYGTCDEALWPYSKGWLPKPSAEAYAAAAPHKAINYYTIGGPYHPTLLDLKNALISGYIFTFGFTVYSNFEDGTVSRTGLMSMPTGHSVGGHCVVGCGWNSHNLICCANSWGTHWGDRNFHGGGYFWMPAEYITHPNLTSDFWVIQTEGA